MLGYVSNIMLYSEDSQVHKETSSKVQEMEDILHKVYLASTGQA